MGSPVVVAYSQVLPRLGAVPKRALRCRGVPVRAEVAAQSSLRQCVGPRMGDPVRTSRPLRVLELVQSGLFDSTVQEV